MSKKKSAAEKPQRITPTPRKGGRKDKPAPEPMTQQEADTDGKAG